MKDYWKYPLPLEEDGKNLYYNYGNNNWLM
jgi:hypothetical protein